MVLKGVGKDGTPNNASGSTESGRHTMSSPAGAAVSRVWPSIDESVNTSLSDHPLPRLQIMANHPAPAKSFFARPAIVLSLVLVISLLGCTSRLNEPGSLDGEPAAWSAMDIDKRKQHMEQVVVPIAASVFSSWRPERYVDVNCTLCHGQGYHEEDFQMPTDHLPRLSGQLFLGAEFRSHPETTKLKLQQLVPAMAEALGKKEFSLITRSGFGCYSCHWGPSGPMFGN